MKKLLFFCFYNLIFETLDVVAFPTDYELNWTEAYQAKLTWKAVNDNTVRGYNVCVCSLIDGCFPHSKLINASTLGSETEIVVSGLKPSHLYMVKYAAFNEKGIGPWSSLEWKSLNPGIFMFNTAKAPPGVAPKKVKIKVISKTLTVSWDPPEYLITEVYGYLVEAWLKNETENEALRFLTGGNEKTFKLPARAKYQVWVRGFNSGGPGKPSVAIEISTKLAVSNIDAMVTSGVKRRHRLFLSSNHGKPLQLCKEHLSSDPLPSHQYCWCTAFLPQASNQAELIAVKCFSHGHSNVAIVRFNLTIISATSDPPTHSTTWPSIDTVHDVPVHFVK